MPPAPCHLVAFQALGPRLEYIHRKGAFYTIEQPRSSLLPCYKPLEAGVIYQPGVGNIFLRTFDYYIRPLYVDIELIPYTWIRGPREGKHRRLVANFHAVKPQSKEAYSLDVNSAIPSPAWPSHLDFRTPGSAATPGLHHEHRLGEEVSRPPRATASGSILRRFPNLSSSQAGSKQLKGSQVYPWGLCTEAILLRLGNIFLISGREVASGLHREYERCARAGPQRSWCQLRRYRPRDRV